MAPSLGRWSSTLVLLVLAVACAGTTQYVPLPTDVPDEHPLSVRIWILRPDSTAFATPYEVYDGDQAMGVLGPSSYLVWDRAGGEFAVTCVGDNVSRYESSAVAGEDVYLRVVTSRGASPASFVAHVELRETTARAFRNGFDELDAPDVRPAR